MATTTTARDPADLAWDKYGWLFGGVWLFFFIFPLVALWGEPWGYSLPAQLVGTGLVAGFCVTYVISLRGSISRVVDGQFESAARHGTVGLAILVAITLALCALLAERGLVGLPFIVGMPVFFLSWRSAWVASLSLLGTGVVGSLLLWGPWPAGMYWGIAVMVLGISTASRFLEERQEASRLAHSRMELSEERERVARDVHDVLGHSLTVVTMKTELARRLIDADPGRAKTELDEVQDLSRQALAEIRATVGGLRVARLADEVEAAGMALAGAGIEARLPQDVSVVDPRHRITLAWALREAVTNVVRHSRAGHCQVDLGSSHLSVVDDGRGPGSAPEGNGLRGMRERVEHAGGALEVGPGVDGAGTRLEVKL